jgi:hypothetical protein
VSTPALKSGKNSLLQHYPSNLPFDTLVSAVSMGISKFLVSIKRDRIGVRIQSC